MSFVADSWSVTAAPTFRRTSQVPSCKFKSHLGARSARFSAGHKLKWGSSARPRAARYSGALLLQPLLTWMQRDRRTRKRERNYTGCRCPCSAAEQTAGVLSCHTWCCILSTVTNFKYPQAEFERPASEQWTPGCFPDAPSHGWPFSAINLGKSFTQATCTSGFQPTVPEGPILVAGHRPIYYSSSAFLFSFAVD